jgi:ankyrin repeat protein
VPGIDVNAKGGRGLAWDSSAVTALMNAADNGHTDIVELLIDAGADLNLQEPGLREKGCDLSECYGRTALLFAVEGDHADIVKLLVEAGADVNIRRKDNFGDTALIQAAENRGYNIVKQLLAAPNIDVNMKSKGIERLSWSKSRELSALVAAVRNNKPDIVKLLLDNGADVNTKDGKRITVLDSAAANGHTTIVELLLYKGARVNKKSGIRGSTALISAARRGHTNRDPYQASTTTYIVKLLIDAGADVNAQNSIGRTALMFAIRNGHIAVVKQLLAAPGIDVNVRDEDTGQPSLTTLSSSIS